MNDPIGTGQAGDLEQRAATGAEGVVWDLTALYAGTDDAAIERDLDLADGQAQELAGTYRGRIAQLTAAEMLELMRRFESTRELSERVASYAQLNWASNTEEPAAGALLQKAVERSSRLEQELVFLEIEWANTPGSIAESLLQDPLLARYRHYLAVGRLRQPHLLSEAEERIMAEKAVTGRFAWTRFYEELHASARHEFDGAELSQDQLLAKRYSPDRDTRRRAAQTMTDHLRRVQRINTSVFNAVLADKAADDRLRQYASWVSARNFENQVADATVDALVGAVTSRYDIVERYYRLKRQLLRVAELFEYDMYAPLPAADRRYPWAEAKAIVLDAFGAFHGRMAEIAGWFFDRGWIDAAARPGKMGGAFSHGTVPSAHPYVLVNYDATARDVMTLAHELGHGVHQTLSGQQGLLHADTPLTTAETASVFGEMLTFRRLMDAQSDPRVRLAMLTSKLEDSFATCFRQVTMNRFEDRIHTARRQRGELTGEQLDAHWLAVQREMFGPSVTISDDYGPWWSYVSHFIAVPGYVYAYAFGELLVLALYARYRTEPDGFADAYLAMLSAGGSDWPHEIVRPLGVDLSDPRFWHEGLSILDDMVGEAEALADSL